MKVLIIQRLDHGLTTTVWRFFTLANSGMSTTNFVVSLYFATTFRTFKYWHDAPHQKNKMTQFIKTFAIAYPKSIYVVVLSALLLSFGSSSLAANFNQTTTLFEELFCRLFCNAFQKCIVNKVAEEARFFQSSSSLDA